MFRVSVMAMALVLLVQVRAQEEVEFPDDYDTEDIGDYNYDSEARHSKLIVLTSNSRITLLEIMRRRPTTTSWRGQLWS